jgi:hypothetical protein
MIIDMIEGLGFVIGAVLGGIILFFLVFPLLERYSDRMLDWYDRYLEKWKKK